MATVWSSIDACDEKALKCRFVTSEADRNVKESGAGGATEEENPVLALPCWGGTAIGTAECASGFHHGFINHHYTVAVRALNIDLSFSVAFDLASIDERIVYSCQLSVVCCQWGAEAWVDATNPRPFAARCLHPEVLPARGKVSVGAKFQPTTDN